MLEEYRHIGMYAYHVAMQECLKEKDHNKQPATKGWGKVNRLANYLAI